jgi:hypothetical protein
MSLSRKQHLAGMHTHKTYETSKPHGSDQVFSPLLLAIACKSCLPHADGRGNGVADGHANQVDILGQSAEPVLANSCSVIYFSI